MLVCLVQILVLLRQLVYSQSQSAAHRVSIGCIGWQALIDAHICVAHVYLSLSIQRVFTALASVAFFKLLIFVVIEMRYMSVLARSRISGSPPTTEVLRRLVLMLQLRFYGAMCSAFAISLHITDVSRPVYFLVLYSFWVPQIIRNIVTEAKNPLHPHFIYGMSATRLVPPLYVFGFRSNFIKDVYSDSRTDPFMCWCLVGWVTLQATILILQMKYGARFMICARFLPPKFDYSRFRRA
jgi:transmembrane E3 ubiquitin-protein ligase